MEHQKAVHVAQLIILLDVFRDDLYEELIKTLGNQAPEFLRAVQNSPDWEGYKNYVYTFAKCY
ncbi:MAG TPA: hypothetical protein DCR24_08305 [Bacillus bacterium]|nr:hypothetical protein [Bacillus sp. (in: firmicutes)]